MTDAAVAWVRSQPCLRAFAQAWSEIERDLCAAEPAEQVGHWIDEPCHAVLSQFVRQREADRSHDKDRMHRCPCQVPAYGAQLLQCQAGLRRDGGRQAIDNCPACDNRAMPGGLDGACVKSGHRLVERDDLQLLAKPAVLRKHAAREPVCLVAEQPVGES